MNLGGSAHFPWPNKPHAKSARGSPNVSFGCTRERIPSISTSLPWVRVLCLLRSGTISSTCLSCDLAAERQRWDRSLKPPELFHTWGGLSVVDGDPVCPAKFPLGLNSWVFLQKATQAIRGVLGVLEGRFSLIPPPQRVPSSPMCPWTWQTWCDTLSTMTWTKSSSTSTHSFVRVNCP
jgi:hypothetical protein